MGRGTNGGRAEAQAKRPVARRTRKAKGADVSALRERLAQASEQLEAIGDILCVMSGSPGDVRPVLDAVAERAARLCEAPFARVSLVDGDVLRTGAEYSIDGMPQARTVPLPLKRSSIAGRAVLDRRSVHHPDVVPLLETEYPDAVNARSLGLRAVLAVPLVREGEAYGAMFLFRREPRAFSTSQVALVETFARQAAIAIENVRLFNETKEALEQQRASAEVLAAISSSIADTAPVFDKILESCERLFAGKLVGANLVGDDGLLRLVAYHGPGQEEVERMMPLRPDHSTATGRAFQSRSVQHYPDIEHDPDAPDGIRRGIKWVKAAIYAPMLWEGKGIGSIFVGRDFVGPFSDKDIALLKSFADQAVIAIQNARLFDAVQARTRELSESLQQQTATADVLKVISRSAFDLQMVLDTLTESAWKLCEADASSIFCPDGDVFKVVAMFGQSMAHKAALKQLVIRPGRGTCAGRTLLERRTVHIEDAALDPEYNVPDVLNVAGNRAMLGVPLLRDRAPIGVLVLTRSVAKPFTEQQIALATTFADQAVIAIENVRLFNETNEALEQQKASGEVLATISSSIADTAPVFDKILRSCERLFSGTLVTIHILGEDGLTRIVAHQGPNREAFMASPPAPVTDQRATGICIQQRIVLHYPDTEDEGVPPGTREGGRLVGTRAAIFAPMLWESRAIGVIAVCRVTPGPFSDKEIALLKTFADQAVIAIQNSRLFNEIQDKSRQLAIASQHKSEFLANMSHELRTPLNAIIGFSEVLSERMFGEINEKQAEYIRDILQSGQHLLSLINDILDLSKIEAGRMELELSDFDLGSTIDNTLILVRERAQRRGITLGRTIDAQLGIIRADERKVKQVLLNLLTNALKFTPEGGRIDVQGAVRNGTAEISVTDTGVGIAPEDLEAVFEEFRQVGTAYKKVEGTGLGLAISRKFIELHGGRIWVTSQVGTGSTFAFTLPLR